MKIITKLIVLTSLLVTFFACSKVEDLPFYGNGTPAVLSTSATSIAPAPADSNNVALTLNWTYPNHATDSNNIKYVIEIDSATKNFSNPLTRTVTGTLSTSFIAKELNTMLVDRGYAFGVPATMHVRVTSSYLNNNERLTSNVLAIAMTPYKVPPKVPLPTSGKLYIVGSATQGEWTNPVPTPSQEFSRLNETTFAGIFNLKGGQEFLVLPVNGSWDNKFSVADNSVGGIAEGGTFGYNLPQNFKGPATAGFYKIVLDFQAGRFTVTPYTGTLPQNLFIVGDATAGGWTNPVPVPSQQLTRKNSVEFEITLPLIGEKQYLLLPVNGDWSHKYSVANNTITNLWRGGEFGYDLAQNFPGPPTSGTYTINVNFASGQFKVQ